MQRARVGTSGDGERRERGDGEGGDLGGWRTEQEGSAERAEGAQRAEEAVGLFSERWRDGYVAEEGSVQEAAVEGEAAVAPEEAGQWEAAGEAAGEWLFRALIATPDGRRLIRSRERAPANCSVEQASVLGRRVAAALLHEAGPDFFAGYEVGTNVRDCLELEIS
jgi:hypothetical protein